MIDGAVMAMLRLLGVTVDVGWELLIEVEIREDVGFGEGAGRRAKD